MRGEANGGDRRLQGDGEEEEEEQPQPQRQQRGVGQRQHARQRAPSRSSSGPQPPAPAMRNVGYVGKHRLTAAIARLDQELQSLQDELNELETMEPASAACQEVITSTEGKPDPLLPTTTGPENTSWDRWFQRVRSSRSNKWWAPKGSDFS